MECLPLTVFIYLMLCLPALGGVFTLELKLAVIFILKGLFYLEKSFGKWFKTERLFIYHTCLILNWFWIFCFTSLNAFDHDERLISNEEVTQNYLESSANVTNPLQCPQLNITRVLTVCVTILFFVIIVFPYLTTSR